MTLNQQKKDKHFPDKASPDRAKPRCIHFNICGGCTWQHQSYHAQLQAKQAHLKSLFPIEPLPLIPCETPWHYRNKMEYTFSQNQRGDHFLGLIITHSRNHVLNLNQCYLAPSWFIKLLKATYSWWKTSALLAYHAYSDKGSLRTLTLKEGKHTKDKMIILTISGNHDYFINRSQLNSFKKMVHATLPHDNPSIFLRIHHICKNRPTQYYEMHLDGPKQIKEILHINGREIILHISPSSFFQPNTLQAEKLYARALELAQPQPTDILFDLYCGIAPVGITFAPYTRKVIGIESCLNAACDAKTNIHANQLSNMMIHSGNVSKVLAQYSDTPNLCIMSPPRCGLDPTTLNHLLRLAPQKILYISCNPTTQSKNISKLLTRGYRLKNIQGIDQFSHTPHIENIAILISSSMQSH